MDSEFFIWSVQILWFLIKCLVWICAGEGETVLSNLWMMQWQVCQNKQNKLELLMPWWDLQLGVSVYQFLSIFASKNTDFRYAVDCWLLVHMNKYVGDWVALIC